jgi:hypothetical protein
MSEADKVLDLDYDSPLEGLFAFLGSPWSMGAVSVMTPILLRGPGKNGSPPLWPTFPVIPFLLGMSCLWALGYWLRANYDVRYQLDSRTQQLELVRKIFGQTFKSRVAEFSQLYATGVTSSWSDDKEGHRSWQYALCLITSQARIIRVSSYHYSAPNNQAAEIARKLGLVHFPCQENVGTLRASRTPQGEVILSYKVAPRPISGWVVWGAVLLAVAIIVTLAALLTG